MNSEQPVSMPARVPVPGLNHKSGQFKLVQAQVSQVLKTLQAERAVYDSRSPPKYSFDLAEVFAGHGNLTFRAPLHGLRPSQPVDALFGWNLSFRDGRSWLWDFLANTPPLLTTLAPPCTVWSQWTHVNYSHRPSELAALRDAALPLVNLTASIALHQIKCDRFFLLENPKGSALWDVPSIGRLLQHPSVMFGTGHMCQYNCRGPGGLLVRKSTQWATSSPLLLAAVTAHCPGDHPHEHLVGSATKQAAAYTPELADAILLALVELVKQRDDLRSTYVSTCRFPLVTESHVLQRQDTYGFGAVPPSAGVQSCHQVYYVDFDQNLAVWIPLMQQLDELTSRREGATWELPETHPLHSEI